MGFLSWLQHNWGEVFQTVGIMAGLSFTAISYRTEAKARQTANHLAITKHHREIWTHFYSRPDLKRVMEPKLDLARNPVTLDEELFVKMLIFHFVSAYRMSGARMVGTPEQLGIDVSTFFSLPIPAAVWEKTKRFHDHDLVLFIEHHRRSIR